MDTTRPSLLLRIRDRSDADAWRTFDAIYRPMLHRFAKSNKLSDADADDITQQCLTVISEKMAEFPYDRSKGKFKSWLRTMVNNRVRNLWRDRRERQAETGAFRNLEQPDPPPDEEFDRIWMQEHLWHCLRELQSEVERPTYLAFQHYVVEQWPIERVCSELSMTPNNVYTIKWRLTEKVAAKMKTLLDGLE